MRISGRLPFPAAVALALFAGLASARADDAPPDCDAPATMLDEIFCAQVDVKVADIVLENLLPTVLDHARTRDDELEGLMTELGVQTTVDLLEQGQRDWAAYRASTCRYVGYVYFGGSMQPLEEQRCLARMARERFALLNASLPEALRKSAE